MVTFSYLAINTDQCFRIANVQLGIQIGGLRFGTSQAGREHKVFDQEAIDSDVKIREDRRIGISRLQFGQS